MAAAAPSSNNVYINKLNTSDEDTLRAALAAFGEVTHLFLKQRGAFAFATFASQDAAEAAVAASPLTVGNDTCFVEMRRSKPFVEGEAREPRPAAAPSCNVYINQLNGVSADEIREALEAFGELDDLTANDDKDFAFATFTEQANAEAAVAASPLAVGSSTCNVEMRHTKPKKRGGRAGRSGRAGGEDGGEGGGAAANPNRRRRNRNRKRPPLENQLYLKGLAADSEEDDIRAALAGFGEITGVFRRRLRGDVEGWTDYAFVTFADVDSVARAAASGITVNGAPVTAEPRRPRADRDEA